MSIDKQKILDDLNFKQTFYSSTYSTPIMFSRDSSIETLSSFNINFHSHNSTYTSEHSTNPSGILSPSDIPDSPPRGYDDDIDTIQPQQRTPIQPLNNTRSTGITVIERSNNNIDDDVDSIRNYATSPPKISYDADADDDNDNDSIHSSLSSLTLPPPTSTTTNTFISNLNNLKKLKHNLSVINEESLHEQNERRKSIFNISNTTTDDDEDDDDQKGKRLLFDLIRQRLPHHHISLTNASDSSSKVNDDRQQSTAISSSSSSSINDQTMREDSSNHGLSSHDITIPSSAMQESGYDSLLPIGSAPKRSLSNASLSTTRSITMKKKHRCDEENDDPMHGNSNTELTDDDEDHYDKKAGEALLRNLIAQVLPSFNPRYLNSGDDEDEDEILSNPRRPSPTSQAYSSSNASSVRSVDIEINKTSEKNLCIRSNKRNITDIIQQEKVHCKRTNIHKPVHQTKSSELRRLQTHSRR